MHCCNLVRLVTWMDSKKGLKSLASMEMPRFKLGTGVPPDDAMLVARRWRGAVRGYEFR